MNTIRLVIDVLHRQQERSHILSLSSINDIARENGTEHTPKLDIFWSLERVETRLESCLPDKSSEKARVRLSFWEGLGRLTYVVGEEVASVQLIIVFSLGRIEFVRAAYIKFVRSSLVLLVGEGVMQPLAS